MSTGAMRGSAAWHTLANWNEIAVSGGYPMRNHGRTEQASLSGPTPGWPGRIAVAYAPVHVSQQR
jgi:hypothetical protein